jgi:peptide/nickel transport system substrate-binding protein
VLPRFAPSRVFALLLACCLLATAAHARTRPQYGGKIHIAVDSDPLQRPNGPALRLVLDGLTRPGNDGQSAVQPALALRWSSENNNHRWQFWLRPGVTFHDGSSLTGPAVVNSLNQSCRMTACTWTALRVTGQSVVFTGDSPMPNLPELLARPEFLIQQQSPSEGQAVQSLIGTGPFRVREATSTALRLEANDDCWQGRPFADAIEFNIRRVNRDQSSEQWTQLGLGKTDLIEVLPSDVRAARQQQLRVTQAPAVTLLVLEVNNPNLAPQLRAAIALSIDRAALQQVIFQKQAEITASLLPASLSGYSFLFPVERNLPGALAVRGGLTTPPLTMAAEVSAAMQLASQRIALNLHDAGFTVKVVPLLTGPNVTQRADLVLRGLPVAGGTPAATLEWMLHSLGLNTPVAATEPEIAFRAEQNFLEQHTVIPLLFLPRAWAVSSRLRDLSLEVDGVPDLANASLTDATRTAAKPELTP